MMHIKHQIIFLSLFLLAACNPVVENPHEHEWVFTEMQTTATCTENGQDIYVYECDCGEKKSFSYYSPAKGHEWNNNIIQAPSCTTPGLTERICTRCELKDKGLYEIYMYDMWIFLSGRKFGIWRSPLGRNNNNISILHRRRISLPALFIM